MVVVSTNAAWRACGFITLSLLCGLCLLALGAGCNRQPAADQQVAVSAAPPAGQSVQTALQSVTAADLLKEPLIAAALATPAVGDEAAWEQKYTFPQAGSLSAGG